MLFYFFVFFFSLFISIAVILPSKPSKTLKRGNGVTRNRVGRTNIPDTTWRAKRNGRMKIPGLQNQQGNRVPSHLENAKRAGVNRKTTRGEVALKSSLVVPNSNNNTLQEERLKFKEKLEALYAPQKPQKLIKAPKPVVVNKLSENQVAIGEKLSLQLDAAKPPIVRNERKVQESEPVIEESSVEMDNKKANSNLIDQSKYERMRRAGVPEGAIRNAMMRDQAGLSSSIANKKIGNGSGAKSKGRYAGKNGSKKKKETSKKSKAKKPKQKKKDAGKRKQNGKGKRRRLFGSSSNKAKQKNKASQAPVQVEHQGQSEQEGNKPLVDTKKFSGNPLLQDLSQAISSRRVD